jgi:HipA-like protein
MPYGTAKTNEKRPGPLRLGPIWMNGIRVGTWSVHRGVHVLEYDPRWIESAAGRPLSLSLPFTPRNEPIRGAKVEHYFDNLLPDSALLPPNAALGPRHRAL